MEPSDVFEFFQFKTVWRFAPPLQMIAIALLYTCTTLGYFGQVRLHGTMDGYAPGVSLLFVPIYEEMIFRGIVLRYFEGTYGRWTAAAATSVLFGLWHLKNIFWLNGPDLLQQMMYTSLIFSPILCILTLRLRTLWPAILIHYLNNFPSEGFTSLLK